MKNGGPDSMEFSPFTAGRPRPYIRLGRFHTNGVLKNRSVGEVFFLDRSNIIQFLRQIKRGSTRLARRSFQVSSSVTSCMQAESGKDMFWSQDVERTGIFGRDRNLRSKAQRRGSLSRRKNGEEFIFPFADEEVKLAGCDQAFRAFTFVSGSSCTRRRAQRMFTSTIGPTSGWHRSPT